MIPVQIAYHVTNQFKLNPEPEWKELKMSNIESFHQKYDGSLDKIATKGGLFMSTTLRSNDNNSNGLPQKSVYPRDGKNGHDYWRVAVNLSRFNDHEMMLWKECLTSKGVTQVLLILLDPKIDAEHTLIKELKGKGELVDKYKTNNEYLYQNKDTKEWFSTDYSSRKLWVNIVLLHDLPLNECKWDTVKCSHPKDLVELTNELSLSGSNAMKKVTHAYHTSNQKKSTNPYNGKPDWTKLEIKDSVNAYYDGAMSEITTQGVSMSTTLYKNVRPSKTMHPIGAPSGQQYWRLAVPIRRFDNYRILFCKSMDTKSDVKQVSLLLTDPKNAEHNGLIDAAKAEGKITELTGQTNDYLYQDSSTNVWYTNNYDQNNKLWVNIVIPQDVPIDEDCEWELVEHM